MSAAQREQAQAFALGGVHWGWLAYPLLVALGIALATVVLLGLTALARRPAGALRLLALAANVAIINFGIGYLAQGAIVWLRGSSDFTTERDLTTALPSLAWLFPQASPTLTAALAQLNPFEAWSCVLLAIGLAEVAGAPPGVALPAAVLVSFGGAIFAPLAR
jgi:hypothetical protein